MKKYHNSSAYQSWVAAKGKGIVEVDKYYCFIDQYSVSKKIKSWKRGSCKHDLLKLKLKKI